MIAFAATPLPLERLQLLAPTLPALLDFAPTLAPLVGDLAALADRHPQLWTPLAGALEPERLVRNVAAAAGSGTASEALPDLAPGADRRRPRC